MPFVTISKTVKVGCKPPVKPPVEGGPPPVVTPPIYLPIIPEHPIVIPPVEPPVEGGPGRPDQGLPPFPSHPIWLPIGEVPGVPGEPTHPIYLPVFPAHPIVIPPTEPTEPGVPTHPIVIPPDGIVPVPPTPEHPIFFPVYPDNSLPGSQPGPDRHLAEAAREPDQGLPKPPESTTRSPAAAGDLGTERSASESPDLHSCRAAAGSAGSSKPPDLHPGLPGQQSAR